MVSSNGLGLNQVEDFTIMGELHVASRGREIK